MQLDRNIILDLFFDHAGHIAVIKDTSFRYVHVNRPFLNFFGLNDVSEVLGKTDSDLLEDFATEEQIHKLTVADRKACTLPAGEHITLEVSITSIKGDQIIFSSKKFPIRDDNGTLLGVGILTADVSARKEQEKELTDSHKKLTKELETQTGELREANENLQFMHHVFHNTMDGIIITDKDGKALRINPAFTDITGYNLDEIRGENPRVLKSNYHEPEFYKEMWETLAREGAWEGELWNRRKSGEIYPQRLNISAIYNSEGEVTHYVGVNNDISELKRREEKIQFYAYHDALTNLPNRRLFVDRLRREIDKSADTGDRIALLYLDLDDFKKVNDSLGYNIGDELLKQFSARIKDILGRNDTLARFGSDEFAISIVGDNKINDIITFSQKLNAQTKAPFEIENHEIFINCSIGISIFPDDTDCPDQLILHADTAMHQVKGNHLDNFRFYTSQMKISAQRKIDMDSAIRKGLVNGEFVPFYQAKISTKTGKVVGMEALARWIRADGSIVSPAEFIPLAEELNLIQAIDSMIIHQAVRDMEVWEKEGHNNLVVSVNISANELDTPSFADNILQILEKYDVPREKLELEITESLIMKDVEKNARILDNLCSSGISCSIDDFGTGYSSLSYLKKLPITTLKIDKSFIDDIMSDNNDLAIVCAIISMSRHMGLKVVAEGVEDEDQARLLAEEGCDLIQGYYYSKPLSRSEFIDFLNGRGEGLFLPE